MNNPAVSGGVSDRKLNAILATACMAWMHAGMISHHEGERVNMNNKILAVATALALWAVGAQATTEDISKRLDPVGQVCVQGKECPGMEVTAAVGGAGSGNTPDQVIAKHCNACHGTGLLNAPKIGDADAWNKRASEQGGLSGLLAKAITGINAMPPKGTCAECSDDELKGAIQKMSGLK